MTYLNDSSIMHLIAMGIALILVVAVFFCCVVHERDEWRDK